MLQNTKGLLLVKLHKSILTKLLFTRRDRLHIKLSHLIQSRGKQHDTESNGIFDYTDIKTLCILAFVLCMGIFF